MCFSHLPTKWEEFFWENFISNYKGSFLTSNDWQFSRLFQVVFHVLIQGCQISICFSFSTVFAIGNYRLLFCQMTSLLRRPYVSFQWKLATSPTSEYTDQHWWLLFVPNSQPNCTLRIREVVFMIFLFFYVPCLPCLCAQRLYDHQAILLQIKIGPRHKVLSRGWSMETFKWDAFTEKLLGNHDPGVVASQKVAQMMRFITRVCDTAMPRWRILPNRRSNYLRNKEIAKLRVARFWARKICQRSRKRPDFDEKFAEESVWMLFPVDPLNSLLKPDPTGLSAYWRHTWEKGFSQSVDLAKTSFTTAPKDIQDHTLRFALFVR